jgi:hypothetical protein
MSLKLLPLFFFSYSFLYAGEINDYMLMYKSTGKSDYVSEKSIIQKYSIPNLIEGLSSFFSDSTTSVRSKAYYFIYKKGITSKTKHQQKAVLKLLDACKDKNGGIVGQALSYLQEFPPESFEKEAKNTIDNLLGKNQVFHFKKLVMLAGSIGTGREIMHKRLLQPDINNETRWILSLGLARQGNDELTNYCMEQVKNMSINNDFVSYIVPDLIYTRQTSAINYCIEIINSDKKACFSPNPDKPEFILCGYRVMELLAPVIEDFPYKTDATGSLITNDYKKALTETRNWFAKNPTYRIK